MCRTRFTKTAISMLAVTLLSALLVGGCSEECDCDDNSGSNDIAVQIVNAPGEAWVSTSPLTAARYYANGTWEGLNPRDNGTAWCVGVTGTWSINGNRLTALYGGLTLVGTVSISGNTLNATFEGETHGWPPSVTLTRTSNVTFLGECQYY